MNFVLGVGQGLRLGNVNWCVRGADILLAALRRDRSKPPKLPLDDPTEFVGAHLIARLGGLDPPLKAKPLIDILRAKAILIVVKAKVRTGEA
jgi:hypothetical protein